MKNYLIELLIIISLINKLNYFYLIYIKYFFILLGIGDWGLGIGDWGLGGGAPTPKPKTQPPKPPPPKIKKKKLILYL